MNGLVNRNALFNDFFRDFTSPGFFVRPLHGEPLPQASKIKIDVQEAGNAYKVQAEVPGVAKEDIDLSIDGAIVTIKAEIKQYDEQKEGERVLRSERYYGSVARSFQLPVEIDTAKAEAKYENGVLTLTLPKQTAASAQRLTIQ